MTDPVSWQRQEAQYAPTWAWLARSFLTGAPLSMEPHVRGAGSLRVAALRLLALAAGVWAGLAHIVAAPAAQRLAWASWTASAVVLTAVGSRGAARVWFARHRRRWVAPLDAALRPLVGWPPNLPAHVWLDVPPELAEAPGGVAVGLPAGFAGSDEQRRRIEQTVREKLALGGPERTSCVWRMTSRQHYVQFGATARPPARAPFRDPAVRQIIERAKESRPVIGLGPGGRPVAVDLDSESPHMAVSAGTGAGKSNMLRVIAAQLMHHGASLVVLDLKRRSQRAFKGLEGVTYCREPAEIHRTLIEQAAEAMDRNRLADNYPDDVEPAWQRRVILLEELNATMEELAAYWREDLGERGPSPAIKAYRQILFMGRAVKVHILTSAQLLTAQSAGGPAARAQYGTIVMSRFKPQGWKMLLPDITPIPKAGKHPGRGWVALGGEADETQIIFMTERETRQWAASGHPSTVAVSRSPRPAVPQGKPTATVARQPAPAPAEDPSGAGPEQTEGLVSLWQASADKGDAVVSLRYDHLRKAAERGGEFPQPVCVNGRALLYTPESLQRWATNRETAKRPQGGEPA